MAINYRDYGAFEGSTAPQVPINTIKHSDVYLATHDGEGNRLPYCERSFISFTYGGRHIEDFGAIAVTEGDRWSHPMYAEFSDITNNPEVYDGQLYWDTHHGANTWELQLSTDCMTEKNLNDFKNWFKPGVIRELILAEHPNRAIMARVSAVPAMSVLPFEEDSEVTLGSTSYKVRSTVYKGEISLSFVMDYPFWYAKNNILTLPDPESEIPDIVYPNGQNYSGNFNVEDSVKIIIEDNLVADDYISIQAEGAIAAFESPIEANLTSVEVTIDPVQDLHGYDNPWPAGGGKNLFSPPTSVMVQDGITVETTSSGEVWIHGTSTKESGYTSFDFGSIPTSIINQTVTTSINEKMLGIGVLFGSGNGNLNLTLADTVTYKTGEYLDGGSFQCRINVRYDVGTIDKKFKIQLEVGSTATAWSPYSNICPISGWTGVQVSRTGKNLSSVSEYADTQQPRNFWGTNWPSMISVLNALPVGTYTITINFKTTTIGNDNPTVGMPYILATVGENVIAITAYNVQSDTSPSVGKIYTKTVTFTIEPETKGNISYCYLYCGNGVSTSGTFEIFNIQLELGSTATDYEPYTGTTYPISWQTAAGTVYGGTLDVTSGVLTVTHAFETITKDSAWYSFTTGTGNSSAVIQLSEWQNVKYVDGISSYNGAISSTGVELQNYWVNARQNESCANMGFAYSSGGQLRVHMTDIVSITDLASFKAAFPDTQICYPLATPITYQLASQQITALKGANNVWRDTGDTAIDFTPGMVSPGYFIGDIETGVITLRNEAGSNPSYGYMYYAGTAPCRPIIEFDLTPVANATTGYYIAIPRNSIGTVSEQTNPYNYIRFESENKYDLNITTSGIYSTYNYARQILDEYATGVSWEELRVAFRDYLKHYDVRAFMMRIVDRCQNGSEEAVISSTDVTNMLNWMQDYLKDATNPSILASAHYVINCETGRARIEVNHCTLVYDELQDSWTPTYEIVEEDAGDMLKSKYLKLEDRNYLLDNHTCGTWDITHKQYAYRISTNFPELNNFKVSYKNMYY